MSEPNFPPYKKEKLSRLTGYAANSRTHSTEQIKQIADSITEFGFTNPILVDENGMIIAGHGRLAAAQLLGINEVPTITLAGLTEAQKRAYVIADNKLALNAGWDESILQMELKLLSDDDFDLSLTGFSDLEISNLGLGVKEADFPQLKDGDREPFQQMAFVLSDDQVELVKNALEISAGMGAFAGDNQNRNGNALARICSVFMEREHGKC